jgi:hypothetical protein
MAKDTFEKNKVEQYLIDLMLNYREVEENLWVLEDEEHNLTGTMIMFNEPLVIFRMVLMNVPEDKDNRFALFTKLLELNARDVVYGAYALEQGEGQGQIILVNTLSYETMDSEEFQSTLDAFGLVSMSHYPILTKYR